MKKLALFLALISAFSFATNAQFYYNVCRTVLDNGGGNYGSVTRDVDDHFDLGGKLIGQDVTIHCAGNGTQGCPNTIAPPGGGWGGDDFEDLPSNVALYCEQAYEDLTDGEDDNLFPLSVNVLGSDDVVYHITASISIIEGGKNYNFLITAP
jgi:hypothetical protein